MNDDFRREHQRLLAKAVSVPHIEHFRVPYYSPMMGRGARHGYRHIAVAIDTGGKIYVGFAAPNHRDAYDRKRGYVIAVGRALKRMVRGYRPDYLDEQHRQGRALREWLQQKLGIPEVTA